ncbi:MAG: hypothetical protein HYR91_08610 [Flavobacteriia bacterium]|nr:hypothetical protein [Flavobacteriia bacterium]
MKVLNFFSWIAIVILTFSFSIKSTRFKQNTFQAIEIDSVVKIAGIQNEFIIDYQFLENNVYVEISKIKKNYYLKTVDANNTAESHLLDIKPTDLVKDVSGNVYVLTKDKAYQLKINPFVDFDCFYTMEHFNKFIANTIQIKPDYVLTQNIDKNTKEYSVLLNKKDSETQKIVTINYLNSISYNAYEQKTRGSKEIYKHAAGYRRYFKDQYSWSYDRRNVNLRTSPLINISSYSQDSLIYTFDLLNKVLITTNIVTGELKELNLALNHDDKPQVQFDEFTKEYFLTANEKGIFVVYKINLKDGTFTDKFTVKSHLFPEKIKINDGIVYFTSIGENGFSKLYGARMF